MRTGDSRHVSDETHVAAQRYLLRVAAEEIDFMEREHLLAYMPHIAGALRHPATRFLLRHLQNFIWTLERLAGRRTDVAPLKATGEPSAGEDTGRPRPNVWIDMTNTARYGFHGGIERVTQRLASAARATGLALPVALHEGRVHELLESGRIGAPLTYRTGIVYILADSFWQQADEYERVCREAKRFGVKVVLMVHDVIPLYLPNCSRRPFAKAFADGFERLVAICDACIGNSQHTRDTVAAAVAARGLRRNAPLPLTYFHLGSDLRGVCSDSSHDAQPSQAVRSIFERDEEVFLAVGTLEPRKGYPVMLDAFESLWTRNVACQLAIVGHSGWLSHALEERIRTHPQFGLQLHWFDKATDADLAHAYRHAHCLVQASITEGFGLPIAEAARAGLPILASDTAIFREIAGDAISYFPVCDSAALAELIDAAVANRPVAKPFPVLSWDDSLTQLVTRATSLVAPVCEPERGLHSQSSRTEASSEPPIMPVGRNALQPLSKVCC